MMHARTLVATIVIVLVLCLLGSVVIPMLTEAHTAARSSNLPTPPATAPPSPTATRAAAGQPTATSVPPPAASPTAAQPTATSVPPPVASPTAQPTATSVPPPAPCPDMPTSLATWDNFQRADQNLWNLASDNQNTWSQDDLNAFSIKNNTGVVTETAQKYLTATIADPFGPRLQNAEVAFSAKFLFPSSPPHPTSFNIGAVLRYSDGADYYKAYIDGQHLVIFKQSGVTGKILASVPFSAQPGLSYALRFCVNGNTLSTTAWRTTDVVTPTTWTLTTTDFIAPLLQGYAGLRFLAFPGCTVNVFSFGEWRV